MTGRRITLAVASALMVLLAAPGRVGASPSTTIEVFPGPNAIANALQQAQPGDILNVHTGTYLEHVPVGVQDVTIQAAGDGPVTVDGRCQGSTFFVIVDGVTIDGLDIVGGSFFNVDFQYVSDGAVTNSRLKRTCPGAEYGVNLFATGPMLVKGITGTGFLDAAIYIGGITDTGAGSLVAEDNVLLGNDRGIIVEDSSGVSLVVRRNVSHDNVTDGIYLHRSDGVVIRSNKTRDNGRAGIELDPGSDHNLVAGNRSGGQPYDLANGGGAGNCFLNNLYTTSFGTISC
jgi:parallel beta-helix repeat protein